MGLKSLGTNSKGLGAQSSSTPPGKNATEPVGPKLCVVAKCGASTNFAVGSCLNPRWEAGSQATGLYKVEGSGKLV